MQDLSSSFGFLKHVKTLPQTCTHHPQQHMQQLEPGSPFCPICQRERVKEHNLQIERDYYAKRSKYLTSDVLARDSILDDESVTGCTFANYVVEAGSEAEINKNLARHMAGHYLDPDYQVDTILTGTPGTGKTHLAMAMVHAVNDNIKPPTSCLFVSVSKLTMSIKAGFKYKDPQLTVESATKLLTSAGLLVLDDLGSESSMRSAGGEASEWTQQLLFSVINGRKGRIIVTTNLNSQQLAQTYNEKLRSRLYRGYKKANSIIKFTDKTVDYRGEQL